MVNVSAIALAEKSFLRDKLFYISGKLTYDFKTNEGFIDKKSEYHWRLYTQVGQKIGKSRYYKFTDFAKCVERLKELKADDEVIICNANEIEKYK